MKPALVAFQLFPIEEAAIDRCPLCQKSLDLDQPDKDMPNRILGICDYCGAWFFIDSAAGWVVHLPDTDAFPSRAAAPGAGANR